MAGELDFGQIEARFNGQAKPDPAIPRFHMREVKMEFASQAAGRPIFEEREFVEILIPGMRNSTPTEPVNDEHRARWPAQYDAFKKGLEAPTEGTPLSQWPPVTRSRVEELAHFHIRTVEQLAGVNDALLANLGMGARELREAARKTLDVAANGTAPLQRLITENFALKDKLQVADRQLAEQAEIIAGLRSALKEASHAH